jgi:hypothetical protein
MTVQLTPEEQEIMRDLLAQARTGLKDVPPEQHAMPHRLIVTAHGLHDPGPYGDKDQP